MSQPTDTHADPPIRFVVEGLGTPSPVAPTQNLVVGGLYRFVRNPMHLAVIVIILGQAAILGRPVLLVCAVILWAVAASFLRFHEEPPLAERCEESCSSRASMAMRWGSTLLRGPAGSSAWRRSLSGNRRSLGG